MTKKLTIQEEIEKAKMKQKELSEISYSQYWKWYNAINKEEQKEVEELYNLIQLERDNFNIDEYSTLYAYNDIKSYMDMKKNNWLMWEKTNIEWEYDNKNIDNILEWIIKGKTYTIAWYTNTWKSQFTYFLLNKLPKKKVFFFSTEVNKWMVFKYLIQAKYNYTSKEAFDYIDEHKSKVIKEFSNYYIFDNVRDIQTIEKILEKWNPDVCVIDFVQGLKDNRREWYDKHSKIALDIQTIWIETETTMINVAQVNASATREAKSWEWTFSIKWAGEYMESSDVVLHLVRPIKENNNDLLLNIEKNKFWPLWKFYIQADFSRCNFIQDDTTI